MASTLTTFDFAMKEYYTDQQVNNLIYEDNPLLAYLRKDEDFVGDQMPEPIVIGAPQGLGGVYSTAQANQSSVVGKKFNITVGNYYGFVSIGNKVLKASSRDPGAFIKNKLTEIDTMLQQFANQVSVYVWGNGGNALGRRSSLATNTITLTTAEDVVHFEPNMVLEVSSGDGSSTSDTLRTGTFKVTAVDRLAGTVTVDDATTVSGFVDNDYLFREGDFIGGTGREIIQGVQAWVPSSVTSTAFFGVDRTADSARLGGVAVPAASATGNLEEKLQKMATFQQERVGGKGVKEIWLHPKKWQLLSISLQNKGYRTFEKKIANFGYETLRMAAGGRFVDVMADRNCPPAIAWGLCPESWKLWSIDKVPHFQTTDGLKMLRAASSDSVEARVAAYPQLVCNAPGWNARVAV